MNVPCPKCKKPTPIPAALRQTGVARTTCPNCSFAFVIRIGEPKKGDQTEEPTPLVLKSIEGVKASAEMEQTAGEIGEAAAKVIAADTRTSIVIDDALKQEIEKIEQEEEEAEKVALATLATVTEDEGAAGGIAATATVIDPVQDTAQIAALPTEVGEEPEGLPTAPTEQDAIADKPAEEAPSEPALAAVPAVEPPASEVPTAVEPPASEVPTAVEPPASEVPGVEAPASDVPGVEAPASEVPAVEAAASEVPTAVEAPASEVPPSVATPPPAAAPAVQPPVMTAHAAMDDVIPSYGTQSGGGRALTGFIAVCLIIFGLLSMYVLSQNNWSLDLANIGGMLSRAFGFSKTPSKFDGLDVSHPIMRQVQLKDRRALIAEGVINNKGPSVWRFIYVQAKLQRHGLTIVKQEVPAGNVVKNELLATMTPLEWEAKLNPAGVDGRNTKIDAGETIAYQFMISAVPPDYSPERYQVVVEVVKAEAHESSIR